MNGPFNARGELVEPRARGSSFDRLRTSVIVVIALFAIDRMASRPPATAAAEPLFVESASTTGLTFTHVNGATGKYFLPEMMGSGVALFDYDNDGDLDVFLVQGGPLGSSASGAPSSRLFRNDLVTVAGGGQTPGTPKRASREGGL